MPTLTSPPNPALALRVGAGARDDGLSPTQRRAVVMAIAALHVAGGYAALQVPAVRQAVADAAPIFVSLLTPETPPKPVAVPPPQPIVRVQPKAAPTPAPLIAAPATPAPAPFVTAPAEPPPPAPVAAAPAPTPPAPPAPSAPPAEPPPPKDLPAAAVQYRVLPPYTYPRASISARETGVAVVRVYIDEAGLPRSAEVAKTSGFQRLDLAAVAAVLKARFKPYSENGRPTAGWARIPIPFELEK